MQFIFKISRFFLFVLVHIILCIALDLCTILVLMLRHKPSEVSTESFMYSKIFFYPGWWKFKSLPGLYVQMIIVSPKNYLWSVFLLSTLFYAGFYWLLLSKTFSKSLQIYGFSYCIARSVFICCDLEISPGENVKQIYTSFVSLFSRITVLWFLLFNIYKYSFHIFCPCF